MSAYDALRELVEADKESRGKPAWHKDRLTIAWERARAIVAAGEKTQTPLGLTLYPSPNAGENERGVPQAERGEDGLREENDRLREALRLVLAIPNMTDEQLAELIANGRAALAGKGADK